MKKPRTTEVESGSELLEKIKGAALVAMVSDDELMDILVLKGGNALNLVHKLSTRNSMDLDFSMEKDFFDGQMDKLQRTFQRVLDKSFSTLHLKVFDVVFMRIESVVFPLAFSAVIVKVYKLPGRRFKRFVIGIYK